MDMIKDKVAKLNEVSKAFPPLMKLAEKAKIDPGYILLAVLILGPLIIIFTMGDIILISVVTVVYPGYKSIMALETKDTDEDD